MTIGHSERDFAEPRDWNEFLSSRRRLGLSVLIVVSLSVLGWFAIALVVKVALFQA